VVDTAHKRALEDGLQEVPRLIAAHAPLGRRMFGDPADMKGTYHDTLTTLYGDRRCSHSIGVGTVF
jgi:hypothetical protein